MRIEQMHAPEYLPWMIAIAGMVALPQLARPFLAAMCAHRIDRTLRDLDSLAASSQRFDDPDWKLFREKLGQIWRPETLLLVSPIETGRFESVVALSKSVNGVRDSIKHLLTERTSLPVPLIQASGNATMRIIVNTMFVNYLSDYRNVKILIPILMVKIGMVGSSSNPQNAALSQFMHYAS